MARPPRLRLIGRIPSRRSKAPSCLRLAGNCSRQFVLTVPTRRRKADDRRRPPVKRRRAPLGLLQRCTTYRDQGAVSGGLEHPGAANLPQAKKAPKHRIEEGVVRPAHRRPPTLCDLATSAIRSASAIARRTSSPDRYRSRRRRSATAATDARCVVIRWSARP